MGEETRKAVARLDAIIARLKDDQVDADELRALLRHDSILVRVNALEALARKAVDDEGLIDDLVAAARDPSNGARLLGPTVAHVAVACLLKSGTERGRGEARRILDEWQEPDRDDLLWFLRSQSLSLP